MTALASWPARPLAACTWTPPHPQPLPASIVSVSSFASLMLWATSKACRQLFPHPEDEHQSFATLTSV